ncbi:MAG: phosphoribosylamine--glycine ligase [Eubacteriales bacterium]|nr:phosphoribosylamine--glycine ligase [Eubacteriales bacterium]
MKILVVGSGGREHAIIHKISKSKKVEKIYCAPGNDGIGQIAELVPIPVMEFDSLIKFAKEKEIDLVVASMDDTLVAGIVDKFEENGIRIFGPNKACAIIEGSKAFSKELMKKYNIPTAKYETFTEYEKALEYIKSSKMPIVIKADGLAFGKGVIICENLEDAQNAIKEIMVDKKFGDSGNSIVIEEFMTGPEVSVLCFCDGKDIVPMVSAQDHKRAFDGDKGLNTGGMGTISPTRFYTEEISEICMQKIYKPTMEALIKEGRPFKGVIFFGLMITEDGPKVIEYNARFGDPETQVVLPRLKTDLVEIMEACIDGRLSEINIEWEDNATVCVILASGGYPNSFNKGYEITGLENFKSDENIYIYHAGTKLENGKYVTNGGRVLGVMAKGENMETAKKLAYESVSKIKFENMHFRKDIGNK